ncbi:MAG: hypothetical protein QF902_03110 [Rhodospirillales bacterium]|jgi:hypothetical protein|nr:hypothetical protein [Rhodospirillales bacterium]
MSEHLQPPAENDSAGIAAEAETPGTAGGATPATQSRALAETVVASLIERLRTEARRKGGMLSLEDLDSLARELQGKIETLQAIFQESFEAYVKVRERASWEQSREFPFDRLIVRKFAHLFPQDEATRLGGGIISRRMLPGFFIALGMMLGEEVVESYQERCRQIIERLTDPETNELDWYWAYDDEANAVVLEALAAMALYFDALEKRVGWFVELVNEHLAPPDPKREGEAAATWEFNPHDFMRFLKALFRDLREAMETETGRLRITRMHGAEACAKLADIMARIDAAIEREEV